MSEREKKTGGFKGEPSIWNVSMALAFRGCRIDRR